MSNIKLNMFLLVIYQWHVLSLLALRLDLLYILSLIEDIHLAIEVDINFVVIEEEDTEEIEGIAEVDMEDSQGDMISDMIVVQAMLLILVVKSVEVIIIVLFDCWFRMDSTYQPARASSPSNSQSFPSHAYSVTANQSSSNQSLLHLIHPLRGT